MADRRNREHDAQPPERVETEGMGGAGGGDIDDVGDVGYPREVERDPLRGSDISGAMGGAGGGDIDDVGDVGFPEIAPGGSGEDIEIAREMADAGLDVVQADTGTVTGITTGVDTDDAADGPEDLLDNLDEGLRERSRRGTDRPM